jgi:aquaporin Z
MAKNAPQSNAAEIMPSIDDDTWAVDESAGPTFVGRLFAEFLGTFFFMLAGLGISVFALLLTNTNDGRLASGLAWGLPLFVLVAVIGPISGAHFNPAVTVGLWVAGRFPGRDVALYIVAQVAGAIAAGGLVMYFSGTFTGIGDAAAGEPSAGTVMQYVSIGYGTHSPAQVAMFPAALIEFIATGLLIAVVLGATSKRASKAQAPAAIGLGIAVLVMLAAPLTNAGLNPARASATAVFARVADATTGAVANAALGQLWLWWVVTLFAGAFVGLLFRGFGPVEDLRALEGTESPEL